MITLGSAIAPVLVSVAAMSVARFILIRLGAPCAGWMVNVSQLGPSSILMMIGGDFGEFLVGGGDLFDEDGRSSVCWESGEILFVVPCLVCIVELG